MSVVMRESVDRLPTLGTAMHLYVVPTEAEREPNVSLIGDIASPPAVASWAPHYSDSTPAASSVGDLATSAKRGPSSDVRHPPT